ITQRIPDPSADQALRLKRMHKVDQGSALLGRDAARCVEPDQADRTIIGKQFAYLRFDVVFDIAREVLVFLDEVPIIAVAVRMMPVLRLRVVEAKQYPLAPALRRQLL